MQKFTRLNGVLFFLFGVTAFSGCGQQAYNTNPPLGQNLVTAGNPKQDQTVGDKDNSFRVMAKGALADLRAQNLIASPQDPKAMALLGSLVERTSVKFPADIPSPTPSPSGTASDAANLVVGIPVGLIGEQYVFDGVITKVSDQNSVPLGDLKLTDLTAVHVVLKLVRDEQNNLALGMFGCVRQCDEHSELSLIEGFPVVGVDTDKSIVMVDLAPASKDLDLLGILDPQGQATHLKSVSQNMTAFDYSYSTLVFDVESHMLPVAPNAQPALGSHSATRGFHFVTPPDGTPAQETVFTTRWFLRLASAFNPAFEARPPTEGVGFFLTERSAKTHIQRWSSTSTGGQAVVHYYVKNVPAEYKAAFQSAFDEWNEKLKPILGVTMFSYEFLDANDPRLPFLVPGDPRYNIVEWDLVNKASYGGLGPSIANQFTGENITANVYIQGPTIEKLYKSWFKVNAQAQELRASGQNRAADVLLIESRHEIFDQLDDLKAGPALSLKKADKFDFRIHSQRPELADPSAERNDFEPLPVGMDYDKYMYGYFHDMLTHELGHNLGMRHNFRGNMGATGLGQGQVSRSVMEYLNRGFREFDGVDEYDLMALSYGYTGKMPEHTNWFCTDENQGSETNPTQSAECTENDATADPFAWYQSRLAEAINYLVNRGDAGAPTWTTDEMQNELKIAIQGMGLYASSAAATASTWTNFFNGGDRPASDAASVKAYVVEKLKAQLCDPSLPREAALKSSNQAQAVTTANIQALKDAAVKYLAPLQSITAADIACQ